MLPGLLQGFWVRGVNTSVHAKLGGSGGILPWYLRALDRFCALLSHKSLAVPMPINLPNPGGGGGGGLNALVYNIQYVQCPSG